MGQYIHIKNRVTGEESIIDLKYSRQRRLALGFVNKTSFFPYIYKHITLTQRVENYQPRFLNSFLSKMRRFYEGFLYFWTVEEQARGVLHWHIVAAFSYDIDFSSDDVKRIQQYWKYGNVDIRPVRRCNLRYLLKYIRKSLSLELQYKIRRVGSSRIESYYKQSKKNLLQAIEFFLPYGYGVDDLDGFFWHRGSAYLRTEDGQKVWIYRRSTDWYLVQFLDSEEVHSIF